MRKIFYLLFYVVFLTNTIFAQDVVVVTQDGVRIEGEMIQGYGGVQLIGYSLVGNDSTIRMDVVKNQKAAIKYFGTERPTIKLNDIKYLFVNKKAYISNDMWEDILINKPIKNSVKTSPLHEQVAKQFIEPQNEEREVVQQSTKIDSVLLTKNDNEIFIAEIRQNLHALTVANNIVGEAFQTAGSVAIGLGVPTLVVGVALCIYGNVDIPSIGDVFYDLMKDRDRSLQILREKNRCKEASYYLMPIGASLTIVGIPLYVHGKRIMEFDITVRGNGAGVALQF